MRVKQNEEVLSMNCITKTEEQGIKKGKKQSNHFFVGNLNENGISDKILEKKKKAQQQAMKIVGDSFEKDHKMDKDLKEYEEQAKQLNDCLSKEKEACSQLQDEKKQLMDMYGVTDESQEQKDYELLKKGKDAENRASGIQLTMEETKRLQQLVGHETEYQKRALGLDEQIKQKNESMEDYTKKLMEQNASIRNAKIERLKSDPMVQAKKDAEGVIEATDKEIVGMLINDAKDKIDKEQEENRKKAEEKSSEDAMSKDNNTVSGKKEDAQITENLTRAEKSQNDVEKELKDIVNKMKILEEDLKGAKIDQNI